MKKLLKRISVFLLTAVVAFSCVACGDDSGSSSSGDNGEKVYTTGNHIFQSKDTNKYVVQNGKTDYKLVYPSGSSSSEIATAIDEFIYFFQEATGVKIGKISDAGLTHSASGKYISIGDTTLLESSGLATDTEKLGLDGTKIFTKDNTVYIFGNTERGALNGVYTFMQYNFNFDCYTDQVYTIDKVSEFKLKEYSITDIPDFAERTYHYSYIKDNLVFDEYDRNYYRYRLRLGSDHYHYIPVWKEYNLTGGSSSTENAPVSVIPYEQWYSKRPEWFSDRSGTSGAQAQLCYTAHGNKQALQEMIDEVFNKLKWSIENRPSAFKYATTIQFMPADNGNYCLCPNCSAIIEQYDGAIIALQIPIVNELADRLKAWQATLSKDDPGYVEGLKLEFSAYSGYTQAPARKNAAGEWEPISEDMKLRDNVVVKIAYIYASSQMSMFAEENPSFRDQVNAWTSFGGAGIAYFLYNANYANMTYFYDCFNFYSTDAYRFLNERGDVFVIMDGYGFGLAVTAWHYLKVYVDSRMYWNTELDVNTLIDKYFQGVYKDAAPQMKEVFMQTRLHTMSFIERAGLNVTGKTCQVPIEKKANFPLPVLNSLIEGYDKALAVAEQYKYSDPESYELIRRYIEVEALSPLISKARLYFSELSLADQAILRDRLVYDVEWLDGQDVKLDEFGNEWLGTWVKTL